MLRYLLAFGLIALLVPAAASAQVNIGFGGVSYDRNQPVEVTADGLTVDQETGEAVFSGNVIVMQGGLRMAAGVVRIFYDTEGETQDVQEVIATGGVLVTRGSDAAEGMQGRFDVASSMLTLTGDVLVTQGATTIAGDRMTVNMSTGNGSVDGRVRTILGGND